MDFNRWWTRPSNHRMRPGDVLPLLFGTVRHSLRDLDDPCSRTSSHVAVMLSFSHGPGHVAMMLSSRHGRDCNCHGRAVCVNTQQPTNQHP
jgi:hypothetical protein